MYTKRKLSKQGASCSGVDSSTDVPLKLKVKFPQAGWGSRLDKMPLFTKAEMNKYIENSGKRLGSSHHSVPTSWKKGKTFLEDEYLKNIECTSDEKHFYFRCKCHHSFRKNDEPHNLKLAMCIVSGDVVESTCSCVAGKTGYCNHSLALMLKICKFSLFESKSTEDLVNDADQNPEEACTSRLQTWHRKGRGDTIVPQPVMDVIVKKTKLSDTEKQREGINCPFYEARNNVTVLEAEERTFKETLRKINPKMGLANVSCRHGELVDTKYGKSPVGSLSSYQLSHTESNFDVAINIDSVARHDNHIQGIESFPRFPLQHQGESDEHDLSNEKKDFVRKLQLDEDDINELERATRDQAKSEKWKSERRYRFTSSKFHIISHRQRNHETFANSLMHPKSFTSRHTSHGIKYESEAIHAYVKQMNSRSMPVQVFKSGLVVYKKEPVLACSPDGKVIDTGCIKPFALLEVKCPETKFLVTPLEACSDSNFCCENIDGKCKLKVSHPYYAQVQGQMGITGAQWCDFVVFTKKGMSVERIAFDRHYWSDLERKLLLYYYQHFIDFAAAETL